MPTCEAGRRRQPRQEAEAQAHQDAGGARHAVEQRRLRCRRAPYSRQSPAMRPRHSQRAYQPIRVGLLAFALEDNRTGCGRMMVSLIRALCREDREMDIIPLTVGPLGPLAHDVDVDARLPQDRVVRRWLSIADAATRGVGHRLSFLTAGSIAASVAAQRLELNVLHDLTGIAPFAGPVRDVRRVLTIHDLVSYAQPGSNDYVDDLVQK